MKKKALSLILLISLLLTCLSGCKKDTKTVTLDPRNPIVISVWHYYNGAILNAFDSMLQDFNDTVGKEMGIIVEGHNYGNVADLEKAVLASVKQEVGSRDIPNIFASYADTAYEAEKMGILANLGDYFTEEEQQQYLESYIEEGKIGQNGELRIFPIAKSTEIMLLNGTDWESFAQAKNLTYDDLSTLEGLSQVAALYYDWTDAKTPSVPDDGKAFYGRDSIANMFIVSSKEFNTEIFQVEAGKCTLNVNKDVMKKIWDNYYVPYISGYFTSYGTFRSDDAKVGDILSYVGSTSSAAYFPSEVTTNGETYAIDFVVLPAPHFKDGKNIMVQQGAGMTVTKSTPEEEYASVEFLKWFTDTNNNSTFAALSGYMPVKKEAIDYDTLKAKISEKDQSISEIADNVLKIALEEMDTAELYTNKAFDGGTSARNILEYHLQDKAVADKEAILQLMQEGMSRKEAIELFNTDDNFEEWVTDFEAKLQDVIL